MESFELAKSAARLLDEKKAENISVIKIDDISSLADYFVIANGRAAPTCAVFRTSWRSS